MDLGYIQAIIMGALQGLTEFLPVSSSGHLVMSQHLFGLKPKDPAMMIFDLATHLGTMVAVLVYYRREVSKYLKHLNRSLPMLKQPKQAYHESASIRFTVLAFVSLFGTGIVYVLFKKVIEKGFEEPAMVAGCWFVTAIVLFITDRKKTNHRSIKKFWIYFALIVGMAQGLAILPGISRSGSTICVALLLGLHRKWAGQYSFLIGIPAIVGASLIEGIKFFSAGHSSLPWGPTIVGSVVSMFVGIAALSLLLWAVRKAKLKIFAYYCIIISIATFIAIACGKLENKAPAEFDKTEVQTSMMMDTGPNIY
ncbi:MAG: undecaprenyl-diphosphate phosphatase [Phycisphaerae bacterium]|nr:undecaprenyl-diphosphate phosphatase [Phycisphaerae bacterium]